MYLTRQEAKDHLRVDHDADDADIELKVAAATAIVNSYVNVPVTDASGSPYPGVKAATAIMLGILYRERDTTHFEGVEFNRLPYTVTAILSPYRTPQAS